MEGLLVNIGLGIFNGFLAAIIGWMSNATVEPFDAPKFAKMVIIGTILGGIVGYSGVDLDTSIIKIGVPGLTSTVVVTAVTFFAGKVVDMIWRRGTDAKNFLAKKL